MASLTSDKVLEIFRSCGALLSGHFLLTSGLHSGIYLEKALVLQYPPWVELFCSEFARTFRGQEVTVVIGPTLPGVLLAYETARQMNCRALFAEREDHRRVLRRGFSLQPEDKVLVVDDVLTTGGSLQQVINLVREKGGNLIGAGVIIDRSGGRVELGIPLKALATLEVETFLPSECPLCRQNTPLEKRGSNIAK